MRDGRQYDNDSFLLHAKGIYTNKTADCLSVCLFVYLFGYGRPNRKA